MKFEAGILLTKLNHTLVLLEERSEKASNFIRLIPIMLSQFSQQIKWIKTRISIMKGNQRERSQFERKILKFSTEIGLARRE